MKKLSLVSAFLASSIFCNSELTNQLKYFGHNILVIINFNHEHYHNVSFLENLYGVIFPHIVFYGPCQTEKVHLVDDYKGWYAYKGLADAMKRYPHYAGYLWFNDDCGMFPWNFANLDKNRIWSAPPGMGVAKSIWPGIYNLNDDPAQALWCWWQPNFEATKKIYHNLPEWARHNIEYDYGPEMVVWGNADALYIPGQYRTDFIELATLCAQENLFIEIALPLITACLDHKRNRHFLHILWGLEGNCIPELSEEADFLNFVTRSCFWNEPVSFCHPLKFSKERNRKFMRYFYDHLLYRTPNRNITYFGSNTTLKYHKNHQ